MDLTNGLDTFRKRLKYQIQINNPALELPEDAPIENLQHQIFKQALTPESLQALIEREDQIKELHRNILELKEVFIAFNEALALQEESITCIESSLAQATVRAQFLQFESSDLTLLPIELRRYM